MNLLLFRRTLIVASILVAASARTSGHVLDQYLHASRIDVRPDRIDIDLDLTPGAEIAPNVFLAINANHDGRISAAEGRMYALQVLQDLDLAVDDRRLTLVLVDCAYPTYEEMRGGTAAIRLRATARVRVSPGRHQLSYRNGHEPERAVYLVNALVPATRDVAISRPDRDPLQRGIAFEYTLAPTGQSPGMLDRWRASHWVTGIVLLAVCTYRFRGSLLAR